MDIISLRGPTRKLPRLLFVYCQLIFLKLSLFQGNTTETNSVCSNYDVFSHSVRFHIIFSLMSCGLMNFQGRYQNFEWRLLAWRVHLSVRMEQLGSHWTDCHEILILEFLWKICRENSSFIKLWLEQWILYMRSSILLRQHLAEFFLESETFQTKFLKTIKTHLLYSVPFPR